MTSSQASLHLEETRLQAFHQVDDGVHGPMAIVISSNVSHENRKDLLYNAIAKAEYIPPAILCGLAFSAIPKEYTTEFKKWSFYLSPDTSQKSHSTKHVCPI